MIIFLTFVCLTVLSRTMQLEGGYENFNIQSPNQRTTSSDETSGQLNKNMRDLSTDLLLDYIIDLLTFS